MCSIELGRRRLIAFTTGLSQGTYVRNMLRELLDFDAGDQVSIPLHVHKKSGAGMQDASHSEQESKHLEIEHYIASKFSMKDGLTCTR
eukprot:1057209-Amphidinium_carterae.1